MLKKLQGFWQRKDARLASRRNKKKKKGRRRRNLKGILLFLKKINMYTKAADSFCEDNLQIRFSVYERCESCLSCVS